MVCCGGEEQEKQKAIEKMKLLTRALPAELDPACDINTMLQWSSLCYTTASLRDIVREWEKTIPENAHKENAVAFQQPELVWTQLLDEDVNPFDGTFLKGILEEESIMKFLELNKEYLTNDEGLIEFNPRGDSQITPVIFEQLATLTEAFDSDIIEYDDEFVDGSSTELVFAIIVNRTRKRVVVVFRGSAALKDFVVDATFFKMTPPQIHEFAGAEVDIHTGFSNYLFGKTQDEFGKSKFTQIVDILKQVFAYKDEALGRDYTDYELFITGHSLGGGLAQLLAMTLVGSSESKDFIPTPVRAVTFASPCVGDKEYYELYVEMEKAGKLRHLRISNDGDVVPGGPTMSFHQTGLNMHVMPNSKVEFKYYNNKRGMINQFRGLRSLECHSLINYSTGLFTDENAADVSKSCMELFDEYAGW